MRRRATFAVIALAASALVAPIVTWSAGSALGTTAQTITFAPLDDRLMSDPALVVTATASSGLAVSFSTSTPAVCGSTAPNGATISPNIPGVCTVTATQAGDETYSAAPSVSRSFNVTKSPQTITFAPIDDRQLSQGPLTVSATSSIGSAVEFTTTTPNVCTYGGTHGATITPIASGICTVHADQPGNAIFAPAPTVVRSFGVGKSAQAITFGSLSDKTTLQSPLTVSASSSSLLTVTFTTTTPAVCTSSGVSGATIVFVAHGTCTVQANQPGDTSYSAAPPVQRSFLITRAPQTISFGALTDRPALQSPVTVTATASSLLPVTFTTSTPTVCTATGAGGATIVLVSAGTCTVQADQVGNSIYAPAPPIAQSFEVTKSDQTITFAALADRTVLQSPLTVAATASSLLPVTFSSTTPLVCTSSGTHGTTITMVTAGTCTVQADQPGNPAYNPAPSVPRSFTVAKAEQTITFGTTPNVPLGPPVTVGATASSGLVVTITALTPGVCTAGGTNGTTITLVAAGTCTVQGDQPGDARFNPAPSVEQSFGVGRTDQTITFGTLSPVTVTHAPIAVSATASSGLAVSFSTTSASVCTAGESGGATITIVGAGTCTVRADQAGDTVYNAAPSVTRSFAVTKLAQTITFPALHDTTLAHSPLTLRASASSHLDVTFASTTPSVCTTSGARGATLKLLKLGTCKVRADQSGNATFVAGPAVRRQFTVASSVTSTGLAGYWMLGADGHVYPFGSAHSFGSSGAPAVAFSTRRDGGGYWVVDSSGDVRAFGNARYLGGRPALRFGELVSTIASTPNGNGYWLFTTQGRAFAFGDAHFYGDMSAVRLNGPIVASTATPTGHGYYMVGSDGGVFSFGDARFHGSMGNARLNRPIVGLSPTPDNHGYWLVASDGGVFAFSAPFRGSLGSVVLNKPVNGIVAYGNGYLMVASDGGVFTFSNRAFVGSLGNNPPAAPIVGIAAVAGS